MAAVAEAITADLNIQSGMIVGMIGIDDGIMITGRIRIGDVAMTGTERERDDEHMYRRRDDEGSSSRS